MMQPQTRYVRIAVSHRDAGPALLPALRGSAVLWVTAGRGVPASLRQLRAGSFLITPSGSRRVAAFRVSGCFGYPVDAKTDRREARSRTAA